MTSFLAKKWKIIFFSSPGCARELKLRPFDSEKKLHQAAVTVWFRKKLPVTVCFHSTSLYYKACTISLNDFFPKPILLAVFCAYENATNRGMHFFLHLLSINNIWQLSKKWLKYSFQNFLLFFVVLFWPCHIILNGLDANLLSQAKKSNHKCQVVHCTLLAHDQSSTAPAVWVRKIPKAHIFQLNEPYYSKILRLVSI